MEEVKSGPLKAVPNPFEPIDERARAMTAEMVDDAMAWFLGLVSERRDIEPSSVPGLTDGRIYSGRQAVKLKLVDQIGVVRGVGLEGPAIREVPGYLIAGDGYVLDVATVNLGEHLREAHLVATDL